jgi:hypothetical protein
MIEEPKPTCEDCGKEIVSGRWCDDCVLAYFLKGGEE